MLAIEKSKSHQGSCTPNILPCRINHTGAVNASKRYWNPRQTPDGKTTSYFRGRKLHARTVELPSGYRGVVATSTDKVLPNQQAERQVQDLGRNAELELELELEPEPEVTVMEEHAEFEELVVWGHESIADEGDPYVRGVEEWIGFAESIHSYEVEEEGKKEDEQKS